MIVSTDFDGIPLVVGSILGKRVWDIDRDWTLVSPLQTSFKWTDREMTAICRGARYDLRLSSIAGGMFIDFVIKNNIPATIQVHDLGVDPSGSMTYSWSLPADHGGRLPPQTDYFKWHVEPGDSFVTKNGAGEVVTSHRMSDYITGTYTASRETLEAALADSTNSGHDMNRCSCGFYAYLAGQTHQYTGEVAGVIEGYGEVVIGTRGFRAEKARIVALAPIRSYISRKHRNQTRRKIIKNLKKRYPGAVVFKTEEAMYKVFPPTKEGTYG